MEERAGMNLLVPFNPVYCKEEEEDEEEEEAATVKRVKQKGNPQTKSRSGDGKKAMEIEGNNSGPRSVVLGEAGCYVT